MALRYDAHRLPTRAVEFVGRLEGKVSGPRHKHLRAAAQRLVDELPAALSRIYFLPAGFEQHKKDPHGWAANYSNRAGAFLDGLMHHGNQHFFALAAAIPATEKAAAASSPRGVNSIRHGKNAKAKLEIDSARELTDEGAKLRRAFVEEVDRRYGKGLLQAAGKDAGHREARVGDLANWLLRHHKLLQELSHSSSGLKAKA